jgi:hypothetical protein
VTGRKLLSIVNLSMSTNRAMGARGSVVVKALSYKSEGRGIASR